MLVWIIGILLFAFIAALLFLFNRGADPRAASPWMRRVEDEQQEKALAEMLEKRKHKDTGNVR